MSTLSNIRDALEARSARVSFRVKLALVWALIFAVLALLFAAAGRFGWAESRLAAPRRALREATFRLGGTWGDFADWMRLGR